MSHSRVIALIGSPNAGKSVLFNALTGLHQKVANYPGVTVEKKSGTCKPWNGNQYTFLDLPGTYSLDPVSLDEQVTIDVLFGRGKYAEGKPHAVIAVVDATNLERTLGLVLELRSLNLPLVVALNMMDLAKKRGLKLNLAKLQHRLRCPVVPMVATRNEGIPALLYQIEKVLEHPCDKQPRINMDALDKVTVTHRRYQEVDTILLDTVEQATSADMLSWNIDRVVLHRAWGPLILAAVLLFMFQSVFTWAAPMADFIEESLGLLGKLLVSIMPEGFVRDLLVEGVIAGVGSVMVFLPQIVILFFLINLLESTGYMARAAFMLDRLMFACGLQGRSFVPLLSSFACAIPGVMATRTIRSDRDRLVTILVAPLMTCSARLPVYTLLISAFVPSTIVLGFFNLQALTMFALFVVGVVSAFGVAWVTRLAGGKRHATPFLLELPSYRMPYWKYIFTSVWFRVRAFLQRAGTVILLSAVLIWILSSYPKPSADSPEPAINHSFAGQLGHALEPLVAPLGFDWRIATSLIPGMAAREVMVSSLATVFAIEASDDEEKRAQSLEARIKEVWAPATGFALIAWYVFAPQCVSTIAAVRRETGGWKWALVMTSYMFALAWLAAWATYRVMSGLEFKF